MPPNTIRTNSELDALKEIARLLKELLIVMKQVEVNTQ